MKMCKSDGFLNLGCCLHLGRVQRYPTLTTICASRWLDITCLILLWPRLPILILDSARLSWAPNRIRREPSDSFTRLRIILVSIAYRSNGPHSHQVAVNGIIQSRPFILRRPTRFIWSATTMGSQGVATATDRRKKKKDWTIFESSQLYLVFIDLWHSQDFTLYICVPLPWQCPAFISTQIDERGYDIT